MFGTPEILARFYGEYKTGILGKKNKIVLYIHENSISGTGAEYIGEKLRESEFDISFESIKNIEEKTIEGNICLAIDYIRAGMIVHQTIIYTIVFPNLEKISEARQTLSDMWEKYKKEQRIKFIELQEEEERQLIEQQRYNEECQKFYRDCYSFHIADAGNPHYELQRGELQFAGIYIDKNKNINFLRLDGKNQEESNACIPYDKIHYYEKAGSVHYTSDINGNVSSFGGSISGATVSKSASIVGGLLFGAMGMAAGALLTQKPIKMEMPNNTVNFSTEIHEIDDRSVILNYYSDAKQQLIDVELPADIYNFFQTYLPEKKYGIVLEIEKKKAVKQDEEEKKHIEGSSAKAIQDNNIDSFEQRIKKLKIMYDNGILSEEEYTIEKRRILSEL